MPVDLACIRICLTKIHAPSTEHYTYNMLLAPEESVAFSLLQFPSNTNGSNLRVYCILYYMYNVAWNGHSGPTTETLFDAASILSPTCYVVMVAV